MLVHDSVIKVATCRSKYTHDAIGSVGLTYSIKMSFCRAASTDFAAHVWGNGGAVACGSGRPFSCARQPAFIEVWDTEAGTQIVPSLSVGVEAQGMMRWA
jgi:hypothetical protein